MIDHPLEPGETSAIERGPWHYGADYVTVYFKGESARLSSLVPRPFDVGDGSCMAYVCEIISVGDSRAEAIATQPDRTVYHEAAIGVKCSFQGRAGVYFPVMWVSTEWALLRGLLNGYQKRLADKIAVSRLHPLNPGLKPVGPGTKLGGFCVKGGDRTLAVSVTVERKGDASDLQSFGATYGARRFPRTDGSQGEVSEAVEIQKSNSRISDVWLGKGDFETVLDLGETQAIMGAVYRSGFTISGSKVLSQR